MPVGGVIDPVLPNYIDGPVERGRRRAMPFVFRCGRLVVLVLDSRGERDAFREEFPSSAPSSGSSSTQVFANLPPTSRRSRS